MVTRSWAPSPGSPTGKEGWGMSIGLLTTAADMVGLPCPLFSSDYQHSCLHGPGWPRSALRKLHPTSITRDHEASEFLKPTCHPGTESGLSGAAERMPALHQLLGFAKHLFPVLQFSTAGVHVGAQHHAAQRVALCSRGSNPLCS
jgi:hypothetical protein